MARRTKEEARDAYLKKKYGITADDYNKMFEKQKGKCAICGKHQKDENYALAVDHNHENGDVRGLLCKSCNTGLGNFQDDLELLEKAADYIRTR